MKSKCIFSTEKTGPNKSIGAAAYVEGLINGITDMMRGHKS